MTLEAPERQTVLLISTSDTDLLSARASRVPYRLANPNRVSVDDLDGLLEGVAVTVVRLLGGTRAWEEGLRALLAKGVPVVVLSGEVLPSVHPQLIVRASTARIAYTRM